ncbi:hypothetical protein A8139_00305 [Marinomonas primoryensis]|uniref:EamA domain-containing protein n=1 Tax=Marinomonas primoryensis TaxID=178399 RepID=A0A2Z4PLZ5_9GAMM|nr:DMT family transporter [Marinomonas primoryensis]AWX98600.1 hypothetical protein A8139_00305 [Marinomonas primoryensis]
MTIFLYIICILIWGTSWIAISFQIGEIPLITSIFYRFALATIMLVPFLFFTKKIHTTKKIDHVWFFLQGICFFSLNFFMFYHASKYLPSGIVAIIFSSVLVFNSINKWIFKKQSVSKVEFFGTFFGLIGICFLFSPEITSSKVDKFFFIGVIYAVFGTIIFSIGNFISARNATHSISVFTSTAYSMFYGTVVLFFSILITHTPINISFNEKYLYSLIYLSLFASVFGFLAYISLIGRIGINNASYCMVTFPILSLFLSIKLEGYTWGG